LKTLASFKTLVRTAQTVLFCLDDAGCRNSLTWRLCCGCGVSIVFHNFKI